MKIKNINEVKSDKWFLTVNEDDFFDVFKLISKYRDNIEYFSYYRNIADDCHKNTYKFFFKFYLMYELEDLKYFISFGDFELCNKDMKFVSKYFCQYIEKYENDEIKKYEILDKQEQLENLDEPNELEDSYILVYGQKSYTNLLTNVSEHECKILAKVLTDLNARYKRFDFESNIVSEIDSGVSR